MQQRTKNGHRHAEAFCLMTYQCAGVYDYSSAQRSGSGRVPRTPGCGHTETFWNSRDGVTPFGMGCPSCGGNLLHVNFRGDRYAPEHKPHHGQGVWRDGTPEEAERIVRERIKAYPARTTDESARLEALLAEIRAGARSGEFQPGWPLLFRAGMEG